ncbi:MAG TPA: isoprenyl transferase [Candidatus Dormibacteraeota bacterium]|nr:isoprenyl transferase [Candidatus Dormibacteraeota bacterium]
MSLTEAKSTPLLQVSAEHGLGTVNAEEASLLESLDLTRLPRHIAVIMDGNGRWAQKRHLPRVAGHQSGTKSARITIETCARLKVQALTLYAFSVENWRRPKAEIEFLMQLLREYLRREMPLLQKNNIQMRFLGRSNELPEAVQRDTREAMEATADNTGMVLSVALNYGGRAEIVDAMNSILAERDSHNGRNGHGAGSAVTEEQLERHLYTGGLPDPDLLIRTSGEMRVSNFLLWQIAYAEIFVTETLWPDFNRARLLEALVEYQKRERRYGGIREGEPSRETSGK